MAFFGEDESFSPTKRVRIDGDQRDFNELITLQKFITATNDEEENIAVSSSFLNDALNEADAGFDDFTNALSGSTDPSDHPGTSVLVGSLQANGILEDRGVENNTEDDLDDVSSTVSNLSNLSCLSDFSGQDWKPVAGPMSWVQKHMLNGTNPRSILNQLISDCTHIPPTMDDLALWKIIVNMLSDPPKRQKLSYINNLADVIDLLKISNKIIVLTGAGVSVSCGIPDFRSRNGIYSRLALDFPDLPDPQAMFDIQYFRHDPRPFFKFAREIYPGQFSPSPCHRFIKNLEKHKKLLRNYTQNIDTLEKVAGIENVIECHGSFATASCMLCKYKVTAEDIREDIFAQRIPLCPKCVKNAGLTSLDASDYKDNSSKSILKPDIVFFGEGLPDIFHDCMSKDKDECDLLIVIGSSLKVRPVALIPNSIPATVPQILINREPLPQFNFDVELLGEIDIIINHLCYILGDGWNDVCWQPPLKEVDQLLNESSNLKLKNIESDNENELGKNNKDKTPISVENDNSLLQISVDSGIGLVNEGSGNISKERHMSVDSSTRDSGLGFSADSPASGNHVLNDNSSQSFDPNDNLYPHTVQGILSMSTCSYQVDKSNCSTDIQVCQVSETKSERHRSNSSVKDDGIDESANSKKRKRSCIFLNVDEHPKSENDLEAIRACWQPKNRESLALRLPENSYYFIEPNRYIFPGADVVCDENEDSSSSSSCNSNSNENADASNNEEISENCNLSTDNKQDSC